MWHLRPNTRTQLEMLKIFIYNSFFICIPELGPTICRYTNLLDSQSCLWHLNWNWLSLSDSGLRDAPRFLSLSGLNFWSWRVKLFVLNRWSNAQNLMQKKKIFRGSSIFGQCHIKHVTMVEHRGKPSYCNPMSLTPSTLPTDINLTVHNYVQNSSVLSRASQDELLSLGRRLARNALSTSARWRNAKMVLTSLTYLSELKIS